MVPATNTAPYSVDALVALRANDLAAAESALAQAPPDNPITMAAQVEFLARSGRRTEVRSCGGASQAGS